MKILAALAVLLPWSHRAKPQPVKEAKRAYPRVDEADLRAFERGEKR